MRLPNLGGKLPSTRLLLLQVSPLFLVAGLYALGEFQRDTYDGDLDHEVYFGGELVRGRLIWTAEFHDKLPLVQMLFALVAGENTILNWRLVSFAAIVTSSIFVLLFLPRIYERTGGSVREGKNLAIFASALFLILSVGIPGGGGLSHINIVASSAAIISILSAWFFVADERRHSEDLVWLLVSSITAVLSISVRPYFLVPFLTFLVWLAMSTKTVAGRAPKSTQKRIVFLLLAVTILGAVSNFAPYALTGNLRAVKDGLTFIPQPTRESTGTTIASLLLSGGSNAAYLILIISLVLVICASLFKQCSGVSKDKSNFVAVAIPLSFVSLVVTISLGHFWIHYVDLFLWYVAVFVADLVLSLPRTLNTFFRGSCFERVFTPNSLASISVLVLITIMAVATPINLNPPEPHPHEAQKIAIERYIEEKDLTEAKFIAPHLMYVHWTLKQPRHGFPHASNTAHILAGEWQGVDSKRVFFAPKNLREYCRLLAGSSIEMIFLHPGSQLNSCFSELPEGWGNDLIQLDSGDTLYAWTRP